MNEYVVTVNNRKRKIKIEGDRFILGDKKIPFELHSLDSNLFLLKAGNKIFEIYSRKISGEKLLITMQGRHFEVLIRTPLQEKAVQLLELKSESNHHSEIKSPMPGLILKVKKKNGEEVEAGEAVLILEAMKMENELRSPAKGIIKEIFVKEGKAVEKGTVLFVIE